MTQTASTVLTQKLDTVSQEFAQLAHQLAQAAQELNERGAPPPEDLVGDLLNSRKNFTALHAEVWQLADALAVPALPDREAVTQLAELQTVLHSITQVEEKKATFTALTQSALQILDLALSLKHVKKDAFSPLKKCHTIAQELHQAITQSTWPDLHPEAKNIVEKQHPLSQLLILVACPDDLDDEQWAELQDAVSQAYGRQLAAAASRGKLELPAKITPEMVEAALAAGEGLHGDSTQEARQIQPAGKNPEQKSGDASLGSESHALGKNGKASKAQHENGLAQPEARAATPKLTERKLQSVKPVEATEQAELPQNKPDKPDNPGGATPESARNMEPIQSAGDGSAAGGKSESGTKEKAGRDTERTSQTAGQTEKAEQTEPSSDVCQLTEQDTAKTLATPVLQRPAADRVVGLRDVIWQLLHEDKLAQAFHLASCLEVQYPQHQPRLPAWLLRAVTLSRHVRHASGEMASFLTRDFAQFQPDALTTGKQEWDTAVQFVMVAATLQPALLAPATQASRILRTFQLQEELPRLAEYVHHIATFGDGGVPLNPDAFRSGSGKAAATPGGKDQLKQSVETWWARAPRHTFSFAPAAKVWGKWYEPHGLLHTLLTPVRQNDASKITAVKKSIEQLSDEKYFQQIVERTDRDVLKRRLGDAISGRALAQLQAAIREATDFASQWVDIQEGKEDTPSTISPEQLRKHLWGRQGSIQEELVSFKRRYPSRLVLIGLECCKRALEKAHALFDPEAVVPTEEPLPRPLLCSDLLRIPALTLNDQWEVEQSDYPVLLEGILKLLADG